MTISLAEILRVITDILLLVNILGFCLIFNQQSKKNKILEKLVRLQSDTDVVKTKVKAIKAFSSFIDYLHESGRINLEELEDDHWREKFIKEIETE